MISKDIKTEIIKDFQGHERDTGSTAVQIAVLTARISELTEHLKTHKKDFSSRRGLLRLVGKRRRLLNYLKNANLNEYSALIDRLGLRK